MFKRSPIFAMLLLMFSVITTVAQISLCPELVEQALTAVGDNCSDLTRNSACYGYNQVDATFSDDVPVDYFSVPSDRASLTDLETLRTFPMDTANERWGVAVMNIQANLPNTVPGQGVIMMLVGDAKVQNDVPAEIANEIVDPISTVTLAKVNLHASPTTSSDILNILPVNSIVLVDGFNTTKEWLRVVSEGIISWIPSNQVARLAAMDTLPIIGASYPTPMQAFYLSSGIGQSECSEADPMIAVQSPENITVDLTVNGVDIRVGSLITFQNEDVNTINLTVHRGSVATVFGNTINAGESAIGVLNLEATQGDTIVAWGEAIPATEEDLLLGERAQNAINNVAQSNGWDEREVDPTPPEDPTTPTGELIHIVSSGETLFGIGRLYDASLPQIVSRNNLSAPYTLFAGDELVIPNAGSGFVGLPPSANPVVPVPPVTDVDIPDVFNNCGTLRLTSPLGSVPTEAIPYYWDGLAGATQYQINIFDQATAQLKGSFFTDGTETSITLSAGQLGVGGAMQWEVIALQNEQPLCSTGLSQPLTHAAPVQPVDDAPVSTSDFNIGWECVGYSELEVYWEDAGEDDQIDFVIKDSSGATFNRSQRGESGNFTVTNSGYDFVSVEATTSSGITDKNSGSLYCY